MADKKISILISLSVVIIVGGVIGYLGIRKDKAELRAILDIEMPMERAIREVEVSLWETSNAIFYYMLEPSAISLHEYKKQLKDVKRFMAKYKTLIDTEEEKKMAEKVERIWTDSVSKAEELIKLRGKMKALLEKTWDIVSEVDDIIKYKIHPAFTEGLSNQIHKEKALREIEVSIWQAISETTYYTRRQFDKPKREYLTQLLNVDEVWGKYKKENITPAEEPYIEEFENKWSRSVELMNECYALADELKEKYLAFWGSIHKADDVIDFEIQEYLKKRIKDQTK